MDRYSSNRYAYNRRGTNVRPYTGCQNDSMCGYRNNMPDNKMCGCYNNDGRSENEGCHDMNMNHKTSCDKCSNKKLVGSEDFPAGMTYVPWQCWGEIYPLNEGLQKGTIFPELDKPFFKGRCCKL